MRTAVPPTQRQAFSGEIAAHVVEAERFFADLPSDASIGEKRAAYDAMSRLFLGARPEGLAVEDVNIARDDGSGALKVRVYRPLGGGADGSASQRALQRPVLVYFHGGGFWFGDLESHDTVVADLAAVACCTAVAVDYRRTPEHVFPAAIEDAKAALAWVIANITGDNTGIIVGGDSCGGTLAANVALWAAGGDLRDRVVGQLLIYPVLGLDLDTQSYRDNAMAVMLDRQTMVDCWACYLPPRLRTADYLKRAVPNQHPVPPGLSPAAILTAAHDPVCDDGRIYAERLGAASIATAYRCDANLPHGHLRARRECAAAAAAFRWCGEALEVLAEGSSASRVARVPEVSDTWSIGCCKGNQVSETEH